MNGSSSQRMIGTSDHQAVSVVTEQRLGVVFEPERPVNLTELHPHPLNEKYKKTPAENSETYRLLKASIREDGIINPLIVQKNTGEILAGHTRWRVANELGLHTVPVRYVSVSSTKAEDIMIKDNIARSDVEKDLVRHARAIVRLFEISQETGGYAEARETVTKNFGIEIRTIQRCRNVLKMVPELQELCSDGKISLKTADVVGQMNPHEQVQLYTMIAEEAEQSGWTLTEQRAKTYRDAIRTPQKPDTGPFEGTEELETAPVVKNHVKHNVDVREARSVIAKQMRSLERMLTKEIDVIMSAGGAVKSDVDTLKKRVEEYAKRLEQI